MTPVAQNCFRTVRSTAWCGVRLSFSLVLGYSLLFLVYAIVRSSLEIGASLAPTEGRLSLLLANAFALLVAVLGFALLMGAIAAICAVVVLLLVYGVSALLNPQRSPVRAAWIGLFTTSISAAALVVFIQQSLGIYFAALWPTGFLFWLGFPCLLFVAATTWISWQSATQPPLTWAAGATKLGTLQTHRPSKLHTR